ncbi:MAG: hypothetical protein JW712_12185 [Dehalococcoidales bacterium]|nr:hypothetical protein [Dehalococcoidales bacterium]
MFSFEAIQIFLFLLPGFLSETILNVVTVRKDKNDLGKVIEALIFSVIIYIIYSSVYSKNPITLVVVSASEKGLTSTYTIQPEGIGLLILLGISIVIPILLGLLITNDLLMGILRWLRVTGKTGQQSVWLDLFLNNKKSIVVNFEDGRRILGFPQYYSDDPADPYLYLYNPSWIVYNENQNIDEIIEISEMEGILITPQEKIESIMFVKSREKNGKERKSKE